MTFTTCDLFDDDESLQTLSLQLQNLGGRTRFSGPVRTIRCDRDNALLKQTLNSPGAGAVLVVDGGGSLETALMGDMIGEAAVANGWSGVVIHGCIRDRVALAGLDLGVKAMGSNPRKSSKHGTGEADVVLAFGGVDFRPGAMLHSDEDGIVVEA
ncbi:MAG: ribonuclease E activity regulator RraA [Micrococcaceae bacterium]|uniref:ribonuclease E activity regulator RraA n=1 Tax=Arthrobacter sp. 179 TaxID=3457734 RepID=UPI00264B1E83|nr:ribonuclease E activity regulator RraA [Micrococcaceae bacterium]MDN6299439.1 ribonuclease E activity regulator RraA [Micrococcaceae bacterium]MDN6331710.1 ribonuclease E activity regulator RraA [Micrococcaceae bacterium]